MNEIRAVHRFYPVGQGLFASGSVEFWPPDRNTRSRIKRRDQIKPDPVGPYRWVYDCGSNTAKRLVTNAIAELKRSCGENKIDLLTLSHFHNDHIGGSVDLLRAIGAKTVMLPWAPLWHRLLIGFDLGLSADDPEMLFFADPVEYLMREAGDRFEWVLFVMPSDGEGPPFPAEPVIPAEPPEGSEEKDSGPGDSVSAEDLDINRGSGASRVKVLRPGRSLPVLKVWEFVPYNDPATCPSDPTGFEETVRSFRHALLEGGDDQRKAALKKLREIYEAKFGRAAANDVSLTLYGGAIGNWLGQYWCECGCCIARLLGSCDCWKQYETRAAVLLTGDGNLSTGQKWTILEGYLNSRRATHASVFQVPHHGARGNWHDGLAAAASPKTSIFSSDPNHSYGHPHAEVLRDFWAYRSIQVDQHAGCSIQIHLRETRES